MSSVAAVPVQELAARMVARAAPVRFRLADSQADVDAAQRLRCQAVIEQGWAPPDVFPDGREADDDDSRAIHVLGFDGERAVATARLFLPQPGLRLPLERLLDIDLLPRGQVAEVSRMVVAASHQDRSHRIFAALLFRTWLEMRARGSTVACGTMTRTIIGLMRLMGARLEVIGPARPQWGELRSPVLFDTNRNAESMVERWAQAVETAR